ncbi:hypothetical protein C8R47DRAFT_4848 [Mycena vitilis]|nr:hypothetical protein C8R47DRAFT_4848 [Mycena vitilis]
MDDGQSEYDEDGRPGSSGMSSSDSDSNYTDGGITSHSTPEIDGSGSHSTGMFSNSENFTVTAGTMTNVTKIYNSASTVLSDFRQICLGDIDLRELRLERAPCPLYVEGRFVRKRQSTCRVYAARVQGRNTGVTVAIYEGDGAKEDWREDISFYSSLRHPNFVQLWGVTTSSRIHAAIFHDDLIPFRHFRDLHRPVLVVYIQVYSAREYQNSREYFNSAFEGSGLYHHECSLWIRLSTGRLCLDPAPGGTSEYFHSDYPDAMDSNRPALNSLKAPGTESMAVNSLELELYHQICWSSLGRHRWISVPALGTRHAVSLIYWPSGSQFHESVQLASIPELEISVGYWCSSDMVRNVMQNGWTRYRFAGKIRDRSFFSFAGVSRSIGDSWLTQANHLFSRLQITTHLEDYGVVDGVRYSIELHESGTKDLPIVYLFLCPTADFQIEPSLYRWPECPAYWSLDPSGIERLSTEEVKRRGFPAMQLESQISRTFWDASVYAGLRQFHQAKGFDPDTQELARHLGHPLLELTTETDHFVQVTDKLSGFWADDEDWNLGFADPDLEPGYNVEPYPEEESVLTEIDATLNFIISIQLALILLACLAAALFKGERPSAFPIGPSIQ